MAKDQHFAINGERILAWARGALPAAVAVACYLNGLHGGWLDDDPLAITGNPDVACSRIVARVLLLLPI